MGIASFLVWQPTSFACLEQVPTARVHVPTQYHLAILYGCFTKTFVAFLFSFSIYLFQTYI